MLRSEHVAQLSDAVVCLLELRGGCGALSQLVLVRPFDHGSDVVVTPDRVGAFDVKRIAIRVHATQLGRCRGKELGEGWGTMQSAGRASVKDLFVRTERSGA